MGDSAELLTLFCRVTADPSTESQDVPLIAVLRDTLTQPDPQTSRISYIWLLNHPRISIGQRIASAVPFFYWHVGNGSVGVEQGDPPPLLNLTAPFHPVMSGIGHSLLQWAVLDPAAMAVRATSRAYSTNRANDERLHLEEAISYLRNAPASDNLSTEILSSERDTVIARLELRKRLLGGLISSRRIADIGQEAGWEEERTRSRNWELVRQCADKTGLIFEPLTLGGTQYAMIWFPLHGPRPASGVQMKYAWRVLRIGDPWSDRRLREWNGPIYDRSVDASGTLLPVGQSGERRLELVPLAVYSLSYPRVPLLMVDFRNGSRLRRHEMMQRAVNEITSGVIGISHFTNWYYYAGAAFYNFYRGRTGAPTNQAERLDAYSQFRAELALDNQLDSTLRDQLKSRVQSLGINPREASLNRSIEIANGRYARLIDSISEGSLLTRLDKDRRAELAAFGQTRKSAAAYNFVHFSTLGLYTHRVSASPDVLPRLESDRQVNRHLAFLDSLIQAGTQPEVSYQASLIRNSVAELNRLMPSVHSAVVRTHAVQSLTDLQKISHDPSIQSGCSLAADAIRQDRSFQSAQREASVPLRIHGLASQARAESMQ